jgi:hypothetical protein
MAVPAWSAAMSPFPPLLTTIALGAFHDVHWTPDDPGYEYEYDYNHSADQPHQHTLAAVRTGRGASLKDQDPKVLVDVIRALAILGENEALDAAYAGWHDLLSGSVHFEAGQAALIAHQPDEAEARFLRAIVAPTPQPRAWGLVALLALRRLAFDEAETAIRRGQAALPDVRLFATAAKLSRQLREIIASGQTPAMNERPLGTVHALLKVFPSHAGNAIEAAALLHDMPFPDEDRSLLDRARDLLLRRARELGPPTR